VTNIKCKLCGKIVSPEKVESHIGWKHNEEFRNFCEKLGIKRGLSNLFSAYRISKQKIASGEYYEKLYSEFYIMW